MLRDDIAITRAIVVNTAADIRSIDKVMGISIIVFFLMHLATIVILLCR